jgi:hypothetical protein
MRFFRLASLALVLSVIVSSMVYADCGAPMGEILWMYPEKNATDVPTNMHVVVSVPAGVPVVVSVGEVVLEPAGTDGAHTLIFNPGDLMPNTNYDLLVQVGDGPTVKKLASTFTTGESTASAVIDAPIIADVFSVEGQPDHCGYLATAQWCDANDATLAALDVHTDGGIGWVVTSDDVTTLWPATCRPQIPADTGACYEVTALFSNGLQSTATTHCEVGGKDAGGGCAVSTETPALGPFALVFAHVLGLLWWFRRSVRA